MNRQPHGSGSGQRHGSGSTRRPQVERLAAAPISWGACEVPGWGRMPSPERVLAEMAALGLRATELGAIGFLPRDPATLTQLLVRHGLELVGGFVPLTLHERRIDRAVAQAREAARLFAAAGGQMFVLALVQDDDWAAPRELDAQAWRRLGAHVGEIETLAGEHGLTVALHPHAGTLVQSAEQVERALESLDVGWCLDTGHLLIGGVDPATFAREHGDRVVHVHLKDVDAPLAAEVSRARRSLQDATRQGLFRPLGDGDAPIAAVLDALDRHEYDGWLVLEQDTAITDDEPTAAAGPGRPMLDAERSIAFVARTDPTTGPTRWRGTSSC